MVRCCCRRWTRGTASPPEICRRPIDVDSCPASRRTNSADDVVSRIECSRCPFRAIPAVGIQTPANVPGPISSPTGPTAPSLPTDDIGTTLDGLGGPTPTVNDGAIVGRPSGGVGQVGNALPGLIGVVGAPDSANVVGRPGFAADVIAEPLGSRTIGAALRGPVATAEGIVGRAGARPTGGMPLGGPIAGVGGRTGSPNGSVSPAGVLGNSYAARRRRRDDGPWSVARGVSPVLEPQIDEESGDPGPGVIGVTL